MNNSNGIEVLLVEDNPADARLIVEVFSEFQKGHNLTIATDGGEAIDYLNGKGKFKGRNCPSIVLLDLNLPKKDGREILKEIKQNKKLRLIPVIVLTTSSDEIDIQCSYCNYASAYLTKPTDFGEFVELIRSFEDFWFKWATLPQCID